MEEKQLIKLDKRNYRKHNDENKRLIKKSLEECGTGRSIVIDNDNEIIAGNGVYEIAEELGIPVKIIETDGNEIIAVKRTDINRNDEKRNKLAILDNSTSDLSEFDYDLLKEDFEQEYLKDLGINYNFINSDLDFLDNEELMNNDNLQEMNTNKQLALSKMPISSYLLIHFDEDFTKKEFIDKYVKKINPASDIDEKTQFCDYAFMKKDIIEEL